MSQDSGTPSQDICKVVKHNHKLLKYALSLSLRPGGRMAERIVPLLATQVDCV
jgi:hypothetical protein